MSNNTLISGNFLSGILVLGNGNGYTHVNGDLYVTGRIFEEQTPEDQQNSNTSSNNNADNDASTGSGSDSGNNNDSNEDMGAVSGEPDLGSDEGSGSSAEPEPDPGGVERELEKYARLNQRLNSTDEIYVELNDKIQANADAISSLQNYVANMHQDMNAGFAMSAAISAKAFPAVKGWSMSMGAGFYEDKEAISFGVNYMSDKYGVTINLAQSQRGGTMANVGFSVSLNHLFNIKESK